jgi:hypothetical protein
MRHPPPSLPKCAKKVRLVKADYVGAMRGRLLSFAAVVLPSFRKIFRSIHLHSWVGDSFGMIYSY